MSLMALGCRTLLMLVVVELNSGSPASDGVVLCAFWREKRAHFGVRVCDNLVGCVPSCVVDKFYPDGDPFSSPAFERWLAGVDDGVVICRHFVRTDVYFPMVKRGCFFGGVSCVHSDVEGFGACVGCSRFVRV